MKMTGEDIKRWQKEVRQRRLELFGENKEYMSKYAKVKNATIYDPPKLALEDVFDIPIMGHAATSSQYVMMGSGNGGVKCEPTMDGISEKRQKNP
jgi:hypothetical protein